MTRTINEGIQPTPEFTPHRRKVTAADSGSGYNFHSGMDAREYINVAANIKLQGTGPIIVEAKYWSDLVGDFISASPQQKITTSASVAAAFNTGGRRFFLEVTGTFTQVDIDVAGDFACAPV